MHNPITQKRIDLFMSSKGNPTNTHPIAIVCTLKKIMQWSYVLTCDYLIDLDLPT